MKKMLLVGLVLVGFAFAGDTTAVSKDTSYGDTVCHYHLISVPDSIIAVRNGNYIIKKGFDLVVYEEGYVRKMLIKKFKGTEKAENWKKIKKLFE